MYELDLDDVVMLALYYRSEDISERFEDLRKVTYLEKKELKSVLKDLEEEGYVLLEKKDGDPEPLIKITEEGKEVGKKLWDSVKDRRVRFIDEKDVVTLRLEEILETIDDLSIVEVIDRLDEDDRLDLRDKEEFSERLIGRDDPLQFLKEKINELKENQGSTVLIEGETGIGKTRIVNEIKEHILNKDIDLLEGRCYEEELSPFKPMERAFEKLYQMDEITDRSPNPPREKISDKTIFESGRKSIFFNTASFLKRLAKNRPLIIFLDDLHWADKTTLNLFDYITDRLRDEPIFMIGTYRPGDISSSHPLKTVKRKMSRKKIFKEIKLGSLDLEDIRELFLNMTDFEEVSDDFIHELEDISDGNPLFLKEIIHKIKEKDLLRDEDDIRSKIKKDMIGTPKPIQNVIEDRVFDLDDDEREILQIGSVIGKKIPLQVLVEATDMDELELIDISEDLIESKIWEENPGDNSFAFSHGQYVDVIYDGLGIWLERKNIHQKMAHAVEEVYKADMESRYSKIGYHHEMGENFKEAFEYYLKGGENAETIFAHDDAVEMYKKALNIYKKIQDESRLKEDKIKILKRIADAYTLLGRFENSREYLLKALRLVEDRREIQSIYRKIAKTYHHQGEWEETIEFIDKGLKAREEESSETCKLLSRKGWVELRRGNYEKAEEIFSEEKEIAENIRDKEELGNVYHDLGTVELRKGNLNEGIEKLNESVEIKKKIKKEEYLRNTYNNLGLAHKQKGEIEKAENFFSKSIDIYKKVEDERNLATCLNNLGMIQRKKGELEKTVRSYRKALEKYEKLGDDHGRLIAHANLAEILAEKGDLDESRDHLQKSSEIEEDTEDKLTVAMNLSTESKLLEMKGELDDSIEKAEESLEISEEIGDKRGMGSSYQRIGELSTLKGDFEKGLKYLEKAEEIGKDIEAMDILPKTLAEMGKIGSRKGNTKRAEKKFRKGLKLAEEANDDQLAILNQLSLCEIRLRSDDLEYVKELMEDMEEYLKNREEPDFLIKYHLLKGIYERKRDNLDIAESYLTDALDESKTTNNKPWKAISLFELGRFHSENEVDSEKEDPLPEALQMFKDMGMDWWVQKTKDVSNTDL